MKKFILAVFACLSAVAVNAQTHEMKLKTNYVKGEAGAIVVYLKSEENDVSTYQFFLYVPEGLQFPSKKKCLEDGEAVTDDNDLNYAIWQIATEGAMNTNNLSPIAGMSCYQFLCMDNDNVCLDTKGDGNCLVRINYNASEVEDLKGVKICKIVLARPGKEKITIEEVSATGIKGIAADKAEAANDGKFVENNRVVIKKAGVKYSTTGQVIK